jgi:hypothetical protein
MIPGISGSLLSHDVLADVVPRTLGGWLGEGGREQARQRLRSWHHSIAASLGPSVSARGVFDRVAEPLLTALGYDVTPVESTPERLRAVLGAGSAGHATLLVTPWGEAAASAWRDAVRLGIGHDGRWCFCLTGPRIRIVDATRTYSRQFVEIDIDAALEHEATFAVLWGLLRAEAMAGAPGDSTPLVERAIEMTEAHRASVRACLQHGVHDALAELSGALAAAARRRTRAVADSAPDIPAFDEALIVVYRVLFLLFAEARGLVPTWHPTYRDGYTIESMRGPVETLPRPPGLWESLQAIARLAHHGCRIGALTVPPFNGRLFSPSQAPLAERVPLDDAVVRRALLALTTRRGRNGRERIAYTDLGVEQLGAVYERLLDFDPAGAAAPPPASALVRTERRKSTGAFYTPRPVTEYLVRRTLAPLVQDATPDEILRLRVLDPAMGSGAFLVAACRYLASAYEAALLREGGWTADDITEHERVSFRRTIAQRCLYGVDINPMAVQLGRLSLWLATLSSDRPLTFLDHRLRTGNSLVGASLHDVTRQAPGGRARRRPGALPLFDDAACETAVRHAIDVRLRIALEPGDTLEQVRAKEQAFNALASEPGALVERWKAVCDSWCGTWFGDEARRPPVPFAALVDHLLGRGPLPDHLAAPLAAELRSIAARERFFHWPFEFPEVFHPQATPAARAPGFDAVVGNPPWEMLRGDRGDANTRGAARSAAARLTRFARGSGIYPLQAAGHANLYQLFLERSLTLVRPGGRLGLVLPSGLASDAGAATLRRALLDRTGIDSLVSLDNRDAIFPVHRSLRVLLLTATAGERTVALPCRFGLRDRDALDRLPESGADPEAVRLPRTLLDRAGAGDLAIPNVVSVADLDILHTVTFSIPALGDRDGWHVRFGRELNATDDRRHLRDRPGGLPVIEGKHLLPFAVDVTAATLCLDRGLAATLVDPARTFGRRRLAYREVASATNRLTLIAAVLPAGTITTHTVFCLKSDLDEESQDYLCGMLNSFVANYLVRMRVSTHVTSGIIDRLPVPVMGRSDPRFCEIAALSRSIAALASAGTAHAAVERTRARLQALAADVYALRPSHVRHILATFPLVPRHERDAAMAAFCAIVS